jgi:hypothetical protein
MYFQRHIRGEAIGPFSVRKSGGDVAYYGNGDEGVGIVKVWGELNVMEGMEYMRWLVDVEVALNIRYR